jgi:hypothetical protein
VNPAYRVLEHLPTLWWLYISLSGLAMVLAGLALVKLSFAIYAWRRHRRVASA